MATTIEELRQRVQLERRLIARLKTANIRFTDAQVERIWAIVSAHQAGLSIRKIAGATGLSSSRIHQLLNAPEAKEIPVWLSQLRQSKPRRWPQSSYDGSGASQVTKHTKLSEGCRVLLSTRHPLGLVFEPARVSQNSRIEHVNAVDKGPFRDGQYGH